MSTPVTLNCYEVLAQARLIAPPRTDLHTRSAILTAAMGETLSQAFIDLENRSACEAHLRDFYDADAVTALLDAAIEFAVFLRNPAPIILRDA